MAIAKHSQHIASDLSRLIEKLPKPDGYRTDSVSACCMLPPFGELAIEIVNGSIVLHPLSANIDTVEYLRTGK